MPALPQPDDLASLVLRTDFTNDAAWADLQTAIGAEGATYVSDVRYSAVTIRELVDTDAAAADDDKLTYLFIADAITMNDPERTLLAVDLYDEPGRTFRLPPTQYPDASANLSIANMDFNEFADATDEAGIYRGYEDPRHRSAGVLRVAVTRPWARILPEPSIAMTARDERTAACAET